MLPGESVVITLWLEYLAGSQYLIKYCLHNVWIPRLNPFPLNYTRLSIDFLLVL